MNLVLEKDVGRLGLLVEGLQQTGLVDLRPRLTLQLAHQVLERHRDWDSLAVAEEGGPAVEKTADLALGLVVVDAGGRDGGDDAVVVLEPVVFDQNADLVVAVDRRWPLIITTQSR